MRGETVMRGYLDDPEATAAAIDADGWLHTGDLGTFDADGYLRIVGRIKDMFIVGGFNAYPAEIENLLLRHPRIAQAAVIGVPDERLGEVGMAFVVLDAGTADRGRRRSSSGRAARWRTTRCRGRRVPRRAAGERDRQGREGRAAARGRCDVVTDRVRGEPRMEYVMAQVPVAEGLFTWPTDEPQLIGSRCPRAASSRFPRRTRARAARRPRWPSTCSRRRGRLWAWTTQDFPPPSPPYAGPTGATSCRSASATSSSAR